MTPPRSPSAVRRAAAAARPPIEVQATPAARLGMSPAQFLQRYWQKHPLLIRGAFAGYVPPLAPEDLAGLACEEGVLARLIQRRPGRSGGAERWQVRSGPFAETDFTSLPPRLWTLLVQDVDKWDADLVPLLRAFDFLPRWRVDDIMISYATDGGGVGAHVDQYDVFLVQGLGRRRWRISTDRAAPRDFRDDVELKLLRRFEPTHEWQLDPGDVLYLPPDMPHDGVAVGPCMTLSVGMRAPSSAELLLDLAEHLAEPLGEEQRYVDPDLEPAADPGEIDAAALRRVDKALHALRALDDAALRQWFGGFITRYRSAQAARPRRRAVSPEEFERLLAARPPLLRNPWSRAAWTRAGRQADLFVAGSRWRVGVPLAASLCAAGAIALPARLGAAEREVLRELVNLGHYALLRG